MLKTSKCFRHLATSFSSKAAASLSSSTKVLDPYFGAIAYPIHQQQQHRRPQLLDIGSEFRNIPFEGLRQIKLYGLAEMKRAWIRARNSNARFYCNTPLPPLPPERLSRPRGSLWRSRKGLSREAQQVVRDLRRYKADPGRVALIFRTSVARLLKIDILAAMKELQRENEAKLALQVHIFLI
ncbi:hypothetical protein O6H91_20G059600 [Diphasiastrum complanatum]|uniref:Uncharacterized protein n=1 Tax=Diphasiastrum complanatum TaxID=34168 RepID=A0ACC2AQT0_DIPCM|nr:hypothetical protein O6H91_Y231100 [Diphasiastrum complanatum]KAJ7519892.1 hypothetical protein O6H91_20G059600 [Diphasiastrum complanatum]